MIAPIEMELDPKTRIEELTKEISASRLNLWGTCRLKFYFKYVAQIQRSMTVALHVGKTVHAVLQSWNLARWRGNAIDNEDLHEGFLKSWKEIQGDGEISWKGKEDAEREGAWRLLETYLKATPIPPNEKPEGVEVALEADLSRYGLPNIIGVIDLVRAGGRIIDFKTAGQTPDPERVAHQTETQLSCYALLYREATESKESGFELHHLVKLKKPKVVVTALAPMNDGQQSRLFRLMESYAEGVSREDFVPSPGMHCMGCEFFNECRRWS